MDFIEKVNQTVNSHIPKELKNTITNNATYDILTTDRVLELERYLRVNGHEIKDHIGTYYGNGGHYVNGIKLVIRPEQDRIHILESTYENKMVTMSSMAEIDFKGNLKRGTINCFTLRSLKMDAEYLNDLYEGFRYQMTMHSNKNPDSNYWDCINQDDNVI